jgi:hypothetical protein
MRPYRIAHKDRPPSAVHFGLSKISEPSAGTCGVQKRGEEFSGEFPLWVNRYGLAMRQAGPLYPYLRSEWCMAAKRRSGANRAWAVARPRSSDLEADLMQRF